MENERTQRIRQKAYEIWEQAGRSGGAEDHWFEAERAIDQEDERLGSAARPEIRDQKAPEAKSERSRRGGGAAPSRAKASLDEVATTAAPRRRRRADTAQAE